LAEHQLLERRDDLIGTSHAVPVADDDVHATHGMRRHMRAGRGRHRVAIDENRIAESLARPADEVGEGSVIGPVYRLDASKRLGKLEWTAIDLIAFAHDTGNGAEPARDAHRGN